MAAIVHLFNNVVKLLLVALRIAMTTFSFRRKVYTELTFALMTCNS